MNDGRPTFLRTLVTLCVRPDMQHFPQFCGFESCSGTFCPNICSKASYRTFGRSFNHNSLVHFISSSDQRVQHVHIKGRQCAIFLFAQLTCAHSECFRFFQEARAQVPKSNGFDFSLNLSLDEST